MLDLELFLQSFIGITQQLREKIESWRVVGNIIQAVKIYSLRVDELIVLNIDLSKNKEKIDFDLVSQFARECTMPLVGGGFRH